MSDGVMLSTDLWIPEVPGPRPTLLVRLPYSKDLFPAAEIDYPTMPNIFALLEAGYAIVYQDCRGTGRSGGVFDPGLAEGRDGAQTIAWLREQDWCDGRIGTFGHSYLGMTQWLTAVEEPPGLCAIAPSLAGTDPYRSCWYSPGGALSWHAIWYWASLMLTLPTTLTAEHSAGAEVLAGEGMALLAGAEEHLTRLPMADQPVLAKVWPWWNQMLEHTRRDEYWTERSAIERLDSVGVPALHVAGWFDIFAGDMVATFVRSRQLRGPQAGDRLVIGPWDHMHFSADYPDRQFGLAGSLPVVDVTGLHREFFDQHLLGIAPDQEPAPVKIFVMGIDQWRDEPDWPVPGTTPTDFFLRSERGANTVHGDGALSTDPAPTRTDTFVYDPADPVPSLGGRLMAPAVLNQAGPADQRPVAEREDVLCYTTDPLEDPLEVTGQVGAVLYVSTSAADTDITGKLLDVHPDGRAIYLTDGIVRLRHRAGVHTVAPVEPGQVYEISMDLGVTSNVFLPGHRIRLEVSSSCFPRYDRNLNTGGVNIEAGQPVVATNGVHLGGPVGSRLVLPLVRR